MINLTYKNLKISKLEYTNIDISSLGKLNNIHSFSPQQKFSKNTISDFGDFFNRIQNKPNSHLLGVMDCKTNVTLALILLDINFIDYKIECEFLFLTQEVDIKIINQVVSTLLKYFYENFPYFVVSFLTSFKSIVFRALSLRNDLILNEHLFKKSTKQIDFSLKIPHQPLSAKPKIPDFLRDKISICVAANDAGGAQQLANLMESINQPFSALLKGPAVQIFERSRNIYKLIDDETEMDSFDFLISGTGWMTDLEFNAMNFFKRKNKPFLSVLDHWVNFESRFERTFKVEPNMLAVTNIYALELAKKFFPSVPVWLIPDFELIELQNIISASTSRSKILVLLEPHILLENEFSINQTKEINLIKRALQINELEKLDGVIVRPHPSNVLKKSDLEIYNLIGNNISISTNFKLKDDLQISAKVLGFNSYALYLSVMTGIDTYSYFANQFSHWTNYFPAIKPIELY